jgi:hypothetical protein
MKKAAGLLALAGLCACAGGRPTPEVLVIEAEGRAPLAARKEGAAAAARRRAVEETLEAFISSRTRADSAALISERILSRATDYIDHAKDLGFDVDASSWTGRVRAEVRYPRLGDDLASLGLVNAESAKNRPGVSLSVRETGPGAAAEAGRASQAMRRAFMERGYAAIDLSDPLMGRYAGGAAVAIEAQASAGPVADPRLAAYSSCRAEIKGSWKETGSGARSGRFEEKATAVDLSRSGAGAKALENAGLLAAERVIAELGARWKARAEIRADIEGVKGWLEALKIIGELRRLPEIADVALVSFPSPKRLALRVFSDRSADEIAGAMARATELSLRVIGVEAGSIELETSASGGWD